jgi:hypothetical protein
MLVYAPAASTKYASIDAEAGAKPPFWKKAASTKYKGMENSTSNSIVLFQLYKQSEGEITIY